MDFLRSLFPKRNADTSEPFKGGPEEAKKVFFSYDCNHFYMWNDGVADTYNKYRVSKEQEAEWRQEFIHYWVSNLSVDDMTAVNRIDGAGAIEALPDLLYTAEQGDSYTRLWVANAIWAITKKNTSLGADLKTQAVNAAVDLWNSVLDGQVWLSDYHRREIDSDQPEEYVRNYAKSKLAEARKEGHG